MTWKNPPDALIDGPRRVPTGDPGGDPTGDPGGDMSSSRSRSMNSPTEGINTEPENAATMNVTPAMRKPNEKFPFWDVVMIDVRGGPAREPVPNPV